MSDVVLRSALQQPDDTLMRLIKETLTGNEQNMFIDGYKQFINANPSDFVVDFEFAYEWLGFTRKDSAKRKLESSLVEGVDFKILLSDSREQNTTQDPRGGRSNANGTADLLHRVKEQVGNANGTGRNLGGAGLNKETILMTVNAFKAFSMVAGTEKAKRVRQYYVAIEEVVFKYMKSVLADAEFGKAFSRHQALVSCNQKMNVVYMGYFVLDGNNYIKIGETENIDDRGKAHRTEFGHTFVFIEVLPCERAHKYEQWMLNDSELTKYKRVVMLNGHVKTELLCLSEGGLTKEIACKVARNHLYLFKYSELTNKIEHDRIQLITTLTGNGVPPDEIQKLLSSTGVVQQAPTGEVYIQGVNDNTQVIQQYTVDGVLMAVHDSIRDAVRKIPDASTYSIITAAKENYLYKGCRWLMADRELRFTVQHLPTQNNTYAHINSFSTIAQIDPTDNSIKRTFPNLELASVAVGLRSAATLTLAIQNTRQSKGFLWKRYDDCDAAAKDAFVAAGGVVIPPLGRVGKKLNQLDPISGAIIKTFATFQEACIVCHASHKSIHKAINDGTVYKGFKWAQAASATLVVV